jgi:hypothetical protein
VGEANRLAPDAGFRLDRLAYKVYVRHPADLAAVRATMAETLAAPLTAVFLQADVCRADLLVEIEATGGHAAIESSGGHAAIESSGGHALIETAGGHALADRAGA